MSADDIIRIRKVENGYNAKHEFFEGGLIEDYGTKPTLEEAVKLANEKAGEEMYGVEYGLDIQI